MQSSYTERMKAGRFEENMRVMAGNKFLLQRIYMEIPNMCNNSVQYLNVVVDSLY